MNQPSQPVTLKWRDSAWFGRAELQSSDVDGEVQQFQETSARYNEPPFFSNMNNIFSASIHIGSYHPS